MNNDKYIILKLDDNQENYGYDYVVICKNELLLLDEIEKDFKELNIHGNILFDWILIHGSKNRFSSDYFNKLTNSIDVDKFISNIKSNTIPLICKQVCTYLKEHNELIENSIGLSEIEKSLLKKDYYIV